MKIHGIRGEDLTRDTIKNLAGYKLREIFDELADPGWEEIYKANIVKHPSKHERLIAMGLIAIEVIKRRKVGEAQLEAIELSTDLEKPNCQDSEGKARMLASQAKFLFTMRDLKSGKIKLSDLIDWRHFDGKS